MAKTVVTLTGRPDVIKAALETLANNGAVTINFIWSVGKYVYVLYTT